MGYCHGQRIPIAECSFGKVVGLLATSSLTAYSIPCVFPMRVSPGELNPLC